MLHHASSASSSLLALLALLASPESGRLDLFYYHCFKLQQMNASTPPTQITDEGPGAPRHEHIPGPQTWTHPGAPRHELTPGPPGAPQEAGTALPIRNKWTRKHWLSDSNRFFHPLLSKFCVNLVIFTTVSWEVCSKYETFGSEAILPQVWFLLVLTGSWGNMRSYQEKPRSTWLV